MGRSDKIKESLTALKSICHIRKWNEFWQRRYKEYKLVYIPREIIVGNAHSFTVTHTLTHTPLPRGTQKFRAHPVYGTRKTHIMSLYIPEHFSQPQLTVSAEFPGNLQT